jgi:hypothetical protein
MRHLQAIRRFFWLLTDLIDHMAISHELSSDIAAALFAAKERSPGELNDLKNTIFQIHSTLERLADDARASRDNYQPKAKKATQSCWADHS